MSANNVEIIANPEMISMIADFGNSYKMDHQADESYHITNNFFTPFYSANKDFELEQVKVMVEKIKDNGVDFAKELVMNITQLPNYKSTIVLSGIANARSQDWFHLTTSIEKALNDFTIQSNMYFEARHSTNKTQDFQGANIPVIYNLEIEELADEDGNSKLSFGYETRFAPDHSILQIMANAINQNQHYEINKNPDHKYNTAHFNCFSATEDGFMSRFELSLSRDTIITSINEDYAIADVYGFTNEFNEFKTHIDETTENSGYKDLDDAVIHSLFEDTLDQKTVIFTDYTHSTINIPFQNQNLEPNQNTLLDHLKKHPITETYFKAFDLLIDAAEGKEDEDMKEYWFRTKGSAMQLYMDISSKTTTEETAKALSAINRIQNSFTNQTNKHVFDRLIDFTILQGVMQLDTNTPNSTEVNELIDKAIILYKNESFVSANSEQLVNYYLIQSLELYKKALSEDNTPLINTPQSSKNGMSR